MLKFMAYIACSALLRWHSTTLHKAGPLSVKAIFLALQRNYRIGMVCADGQGWLVGGIAL